MTDLTPTRIALLRLALSLLQGIALWALYDAASQLGRELAQALSAGVIFVPVIAIAGLGNLRPRTLALWSVLAAVLCFGLGYHAGWREPSTDWRQELVFLSTLNGCLLGLLFIGQSLVVAGDTDRRWIATFPTYFDVAWRHATQIALAVLFTVVFFGFLLLGAELFELIRVGFLRRLLRSSWFWIPAMTVTFALAIHFTDTRTAMVRGARTLVLGLLAWLLPLLTLIAVGFLAALPFTGLAPLWATKHATSILLTAAIALILLINSHFQDGGAESQRFAFLIHSRAVAALALLPLTVLAVIGLKLRVDQHGWTPSRIVALAFVVAVACHAGGYFVAVLRSWRSLRGLSLTNVLSAWVIVALLVALMTPPADPVRLSVRSQVARLESGEILPRQFDFGFLHFSGGRYGRAELDRLRDMKDGANASEIAELAAAELRRPHRYASAAEPQATPDTWRKNIAVVYPRGVSLPESFFRTAWSPSDYRFPNCLKRETGRCDGLLVDLDGDGVVEIVLVGDQSFGPVTLYKETAPGTWEFRGNLLNSDCKGVIEALRRGELQTAPRADVDIVVAGQRLQERAVCAPR